MSTRGKQKGTSSLPDTSKQKERGMIATDRDEYASRTRSDVSSAVNYAYKTINTLAQAGRTMAEAQPFLSKLAGMTMDEYCTFTGRNYLHRIRLMDLNDKEIDITLQSLGVDAPFKGNSNAVTASAQSPSYAAKRNYLDKFQRTIQEREDGGLMTTRSNVAQGKGSANYTSGGGLYGTDVKNLYYDEGNCGTNEFTDGEKINFNDEPSSILTKTKNLLNAKKINTIIDSFCTGPDAPMRKNDAKSVYGLSRGRNLLQKAAEGDGGADTYNVNGYNNPYCRVWTHHHQYDRMEKTMRAVGALEEFHKWDKFETPTEELRKWRQSDWGWKDKSNKGWRYSVLNTSTGMPNMAPSYGGDGRSKVHPKDCMFSIENLAWKGLDPYSFETALSWEQRGPNGGRIMWFPPYGLTFSENTTAEWSSHKFIGRGEPVYTYSNTTRSGTLSFMLVVDHPSILDYAAASVNDGKDISDTDILRFQAGCGIDENGKDSLQNKIHPTILTDERYKYPDESKDVSEQLKPATPKPDQQAVAPANGCIESWVFFPNNYSGVDDGFHDDESKVSWVAYLLYGRGAQQENDAKGSKEDVPLSFTTNSLTNFKDGIGYEMGDGKGISKDSEDYYGIGYLKNKKGAQGLGYRIDNNEDYQKQRYVNDASLKDLVSYKLNLSCSVWSQPAGSEPLPEKADGGEPITYCSFASLALAMLGDGDRDAIKGIIKKGDEGANLDKELNEILPILKGDSANDGQNVTTPNNTVVEGDNGNNPEVVNTDKLTPQQNNASVPAAQADDEVKTDDTNETSGGEGKDTPANDDKNTDPEQKVSNPQYRITKIECVGYATSTGNNANKDTNEKRNQELAENRGKAVKDLLSKYYSSLGDNLVYRGEIHMSEEYGGINTFESKRWRSTRVRMYYTTEDTQATNESAGNGQTDKKADSATNQPPTIKGFTHVKDDEGIHYYWCDNESSDVSNNRLWYLDEKDGQMKLVGEESDLSNNTITQDTLSKQASNPYNTIRYDQEYHFFRALEKEDPITFNRLRDRLQYFSPAFHSMTPEGFSGRLTFLQQCMRQGDTVGASDSRLIGGKTVTGGKSANNLAFGMAPYCVLRIGDFYNQMIVIQNITFNYEQWDLNIEGAGAIPLICRVNMTFNFVGGGDIAGCIRRLQNAMSFNYYANTSLYDNRADRADPDYDMEFAVGSITQGKPKSGKDADIFIHNTQFQR